ncbi:MAG: hypothetical protein HRT57_02630 [Crocinitomicaceae bacterium]|nr:hypothetical protein [Crocinitomicaceae bacterium]
MIKALLVFFPIICSSISFGQDSVVVIVEIRSATEDETVQRVAATIVIGSKSFYKTSNSKGVFSFKAYPGNGVKYKLNHTQFESSEVFKRISHKFRKDTLNYMFKMKYIKTQQLGDIIIPAPGVPKIVYINPKLHIQDFEIQNNGDILMLAYSKQLRKGSELVLFDGLKIKSKFQVPDLAEEIIRDYRGNSHVVCKDAIYGIHATDETIGISTLDKQYYLTYLAPIVDTNKTRMYFSNFNPDYPAFEYFVFDQRDSVYKKIMEIEDEFMMELYRSEYKWVDIRAKLWAKNKELETGVDAEIWVGANYFTQSLYYKELYAPMFHRNDSLFVFDYYKDKLFTFDADGDAVDSVGIYHHYNPKSTGWEKNLMQDRVTGEIYALFDRAGYSYLGWVDTKTGEIKEQVKLAHRYVEKIIVHENFIYYVYREFESTDKKHLWRERLPYHFGSGKVPDGDEVDQVKVD